MLQTSFDSQEGEILYAPKGSNTLENPILEMVKEWDTAVGS
jgi:hypothetical protein